jgi:hypothetical protein
MMPPQAGEALTDPADLPSPRRHRPVRTRRQPTEAEIRRLALHALARGLLTVRPDVVLSPQGYVEDLADNLVPGVERPQFETDFGEGDGNELGGKIRAAHSSAALAVNAFARFKDDPGALILAGMSGFVGFCFEAKLPTGLRGGRAPNLDLLAIGPGAAVAVESKCTEYLTPKTAVFSRAYAEQISDARRESPWFRAMTALVARPDAYRFLDAAQLVKHAFGIAHRFRDGTATLLYLFWEPADAEAYAAFREHRAEIARFAERVAGGTPRFAAMSYGELWRGWCKASGASWVQQHVEHLEARYAVRLGSD